MIRFEESDFIDEHETLADWRQADQPAAPAAPVAAPTAQAQGGEAAMKKEPPPAQP